MIIDYEIYCDFTKYDLISPYIEVNLCGELVNYHRRYFRSTRNIIIHSNVIKSALASAKK